METSSRFDIAGILVAPLGIGVAAFQDDLRGGLAPDSPQLTQRVIEKGVPLVQKDGVAISDDDIVDYPYIGLGIVALALGAWSYVAKENHRVSEMAAALGIVALAWHYVLIGIVVAVVEMIVLSVS